VAGASDDDENVNDDDDDDEDDEDDEDDDNDILGLSTVTFTPSSAFGSKPSSSDPRCTTTGSALVA